MREEEEGKHKKKREEEDSMSSITMQNNYVMNMNMTYCGIRAPVLRGLGDEGDQLSHRNTQEGAYLTHILRCA